MENQVALSNSLGLSVIALHEDTTETVLREVEKGKFTYFGKNAECEPVTETFTD